MKPIKRPNTASSSALAIVAMTAGLCLLSRLADAAAPDIVWSGQEHTAGVTALAISPDA